MKAQKSKWVTMMHMLVVLGGVPGSGRRKLAREYAARYGFYYCDLRREQDHRFVRDARGAVREKAIVPTGEQEEMHFFKRITSGFPRLSKMYPDMVMDYAFHHGQSSEYFLKEADGYFSPIVFVWVESSEKGNDARLARMQAKGKIHSAEGAKKKYRRAHASSSGADFSFSYDDMDGTAVARLHAAIHERQHPHT